MSESPKVGEYWYITSKEDTFRRAILVKCVSIINGVPHFTGPELNYKLWEVVYGPLGFSYDLLYKWEPNFFWKFLGYK